MFCSRNGEEGSILAIMKVHVLEELQTIFQDRQPYVEWLRAILKQEVALTVTSDQDTRPLVHCIRQVSIPLPEQMFD